MRLKLKGSLFRFQGSSYAISVSILVSDWHWAKKNTDYHVKNKDEVDESQKSQWKYESEVYLII